MSLADLEPTAAEENRAAPRRERLPDTRQSITHKFNIDGHEGYMTVGLYEDGRPGELFLTMGKEGSTLGGFLDVIGILASVSLQYGVPLESLANKLSHCRFEPSGWTPNPDIRQASSIVDYIFRWLGNRFVENECHRITWRTISMNLRAIEQTHPVWNRAFNSSTKQAQLRDDSQAWNAVAGILLTIVSVGLFLAVVTLLVA